MSQNELSACCKAKVNYYWTPAVPVCYECSKCKEPCALSQNEVQDCGYCLRVQQSHGGNKGYKCKRHTKSVTITNFTYFTQEYVNDAIKLAIRDFAERVDKEVIGQDEQPLVDQPKHYHGGNGYVGTKAQNQLKGIQRTALHKLVEEETK